MHLFALKWWFWLSIDYKKGSHRLYWEDPKEVNGTKIKFTGVPFYILGSKIFDCQHGKDRNAALKKRKKQQREQVCAQFITKLASLVSNTLYCFTFIFPNMHKPLAYCFFSFSRMEIPHLRRIDSWHNLPKKPIVQQG